MSTLALNLNSKDQVYHDKMKEVSAFMAELALPSDVKDRVIEFYDFLWGQRKSFKATTIMEELPLSLVTEIAEFTHKRMLQRNPHLGDCDQSLIQMLAFKLNDGQCLLPDECIFAEGDTPDYVYIIGKGAVNMHTADMEVGRVDGNMKRRLVMTSSRTLSPICGYPTRQTLLSSHTIGDHFGEVPLLEDDNVFQCIVNEDHLASDGVHYHPEDHHVLAFTDDFTELYSLCSVEFCTILTL